MAEPFKELVNAEGVRALAAEIATVHPSFDAAGFVADATPALPGLELKARTIHVADRLRAFLPNDWPTALGIVCAALPPPLPDATGVSSLFRLWPALTLVERHGLAHPAESLAALPALTQRFSAEFAVRPFLDRHADLAWPTVTAWAAHPNEHVRRLASEGTRPRLPWGMRLRHDPRRALPILDALVDDPSAYVRRSVANHLGDIAKDDLPLARDVAARWLRADPGRRSLVSHGLRAPAKAGDAETLAILGQRVADVRLDALSLDRPVAAIGDVVTVHARLCGPPDAELRADVTWSWPGVRGRSSRTFRAGTPRCDPHGRATLTWRLALRPVTTRPLRPGQQELHLRVGGQDLGSVSFDLPE